MTEGAPGTARCADNHATLKVNPMLRRFYCRYDGRTTLGGLTMDQWTCPCTATFCTLVDEEI